MATNVKIILNKRRKRKDNTYPVILGLIHKRLKKIANLCKIEANLTSYVARHSLGTIARKINIPISVISQGYGHEKEKTTEIYLASFEHDVIDKANELITG